MEPSCVKIECEPESAGRDGTVGRVAAPLAAGWVYVPRRHDSTCCCFVTLIGGLGATSRGTRTDLTTRIATVDHADRPGNRNCHGAGRVDEVEELPSSSYRRPRDIRVGVDGKAAGIGGTRTDPDCYLWELRKYYG